MELKDIIYVSLAIKFGNNPKDSLKAFINKALDSGEYFDGFEIAIQKEPLDYQAYEELLGSFTKVYGDYIPNIEHFEELADKHLPQSCFSNLVWLVTEEGEIIASDGLRVANFKNDQVVWVTKRISWDGISLSSIENGIIVGEWYDATNSENPWGTLKLSLSDGKLLQGEVIEY
jgi:hypothetical protein